MKDPKIKIQKTELLSDNWYLLNKVTFDYQKEDNSWITQKREVYDRGNGAAILLYNSIQKTVILTRQFRLPTYLNGNKTGMMVEVCAGLLDKDNPKVFAYTRELEGKKVLILLNFTAENAAVNTGIDMKNAKIVSSNYFNLDSINNSILRPYEALVIELK